MKIIDTKPITLKHKEELKNEITTFKRKPRFTVVSVGNVPSNEVYVRNKLKHCEDVGIEVKHVHMRSETTELQLINRITVEQLQCDSIILQLPLESEDPINVDRVLNHIIPVKDVDGLCVENQGRLFTGNTLLIPATPQAVMTFLKEIEYDITGKDVLVIGRSNLLGKPLSILLNHSNATVTLAHSKSDIKGDIAEGHYDVVISCVGKPLEFKDIVADVIIDCGINFKNGRMVGDIEIDTCSCLYATIPPNRDRDISGGVGTLTCLELMKNVVKSYKLQGGC